MTTQLPELPELPEGISATTLNGLQALRVETSAATGTVYLHGAHVAQWQPAGAQHPVLWMSANSGYADDVALRGGVPICFPWFGPGRSGERAPGHGYARLVEWTLEQAFVDADGTAHLALRLDPSLMPADAGVPADARVRYLVAMGPALTLELEVTAGEQGFDYEQALHTYLSVGDVQKVRVQGLEGAGYLDKLDQQHKTQDGPVIFTSETDRIYRSTSTATVVDEAWGRAVEVAKQGSADTVVWNPWAGRAAAMADVGAGNWGGFCCVETANCLDDAIALAPGEQHVMTAVVSLG